MKKGLISPELWEAIKGAYTAEDARNAFKGDKIDWRLLGKGVGKTGLAYGAPAGALGAAAYYAMKDKDQ